MLLYFRMGRPFFEPPRNREAPVHPTSQKLAASLCGALAWLVLAAPAEARLGPDYQMPLGNPDGASTNPLSRTKFLIKQRAQYVISYNDDTHQANWVGWSYSLADNGTQARTDAWATEELLPSGYLKIGTATFGTGWDRGHMTPSADRTKDLTNNQVTFRMSNIIPQASQNNQGLWANFEDYCRTMAADGDEVVIISGPAQFSGSRLNNQMSVPGSVWKIAVEIPDATSSTNANQRITTNARVIALLTPNTSVGLGPWQSYITSVEAIEDATGFNFFDAITNGHTAIYLKNLVDTGTGPNKPTVISTFNPTLGGVGTPVTISGFNFASPTVTFNGTPATVRTSTAGSITVDVPAGATSGYIEVSGANGTDTSYEPFTVTAGTSPTLALSTASLSGLTASEGAAGTPAVYVLTGSNLTNNVTVTAPDNFEVSADGGATFGGTRVITNDITGSLGVQLSARIKAGAPPGNFSGAVSHASGTNAASLAVSGTVISTAPALWLSTTNITGLSALQNTAGTGANYTVSGANLTENITVSTATGSGFEVSSDNISFGNSVVLSPVSGTLSNATVYVRLAASGTTGPISGTVTHTGSGIAAAQTLGVSGNVISTAPTLVLSTNAISGFTAVQNTPGGSKTYTVSGNFLTNAITIGAPGGFEIGTNATNFSSSLLLTPTSGTLPETTIYARLAASGTVGAVSNAITHTGWGTAQQTASVTVSGSINAPGSGETSTAVWDFTTAAPSAGVPKGVAIGNVSQGNNNGTTVLLTNSSASTGYSGASGGNNAGAAARTGALNTATNGSAYFEFTVAPQSGASFSVSQFSFGSRSTSTGPAAYALRSSADNYGSNILAGTATTNSTWALFSHTNLAVGASSPLTFRLYGFNGSGGAVSGTANWRIDDLKVTVATTGVTAPKPVITSAATAGGAAQVPFEYLIKADNAPTYFGASGLPAGLSVDNATGRISGTPTEPGSYTVLLTASNASGDGTMTLVLQVGPVPVPLITSATAAVAAVDVAFNYQIEADNSPTAYLADGLPPGLVFDALNGTISGAPTTTGASDVVITAINSFGRDTKTLALTVLAPVIEVSQSKLSFTNSFLQASAAQTYSLTGSGLAEAVTVLAPGSFEVSDDGGANYFDELTVTPAADRTIGATISVRMKETAPLGESKGAIINSGANAVPKYVQLDGSSVAAAATIDLSAWTLAGFSAKTGAPSLTQSYTVSGGGLTGPVTITAPNGFQISSDNNSFSSSLVLTPDARASINAQEIFVRLEAASAGTFAGSIGHGGGGAASKQLAVSGTVTAPAGPPIISPLSGSAYTNAAFKTKIAVGGTMPATNFAATGLPGTLQINQSNGIVSGNVPALSGSSVFAVAATTPEGTTTTNYNLRVVSSAEQNSIPTSVVVNKFQNGLPDRVELLVIGSTNDASPGPPVDMRGMLLKDFSSSRTADEGGKYRFTTNALWSSVKAGTLVVLSAGNQGTETIDTSSTNFVLRVNLGNEAFFKQEAPGFDLDDLDMVMVKPADMGIEGFAGGIHALGAGKVSGLTVYGSYIGKKIRSDQSLNSSRNTVYANASSLSGFNLQEDKAALTASTLVFGAGNTSGNTNYINSLRALDQTPPVVTLISNATVNLVVGDNYTEPSPGATAFDARDNQSKSVTRSGTFDTAVAGTYTLTYSATDSSGNLGTAHRRVVVRTRAAHFLEIEKGLSGAEAAFSADADRDGAANLVEYAMGSDPTSQTNAPTRPAGEMSAGALRITTLVRTNDSDLGIKAKASTDLRSLWTTNGVTEMEGVAQTNVPSGLRRRTWEVANTNQAAQFMRLDVNYP